jgi:hypothetical protein
MFCVAAVLTAVGAASPAAVAIVAPIALGFAYQYSINPLLMGLLVVHGAQAGGFSPISIYGAIVNGLVARAGLPQGEITLLAPLWRSWLPRWPGLSSWYSGSAHRRRGPMSIWVCPAPQLCGPGAPASQVPRRSSGSNLSTGSLSTRPTTPRSGVPRIAPGSGKECRSGGRH